MQTELFPVYAWGHFLGGGIGARAKSRSGDVLATLPSAYHSAAPVLWVGVSLFICLKCSVSFLQSSGSPSKPCWVSKQVKGIIFLHLSPGQGCPIWGSNYSLLKDWHPFSLSLSLWHAFSQLDCLPGVWARTSLLLLTDSVWFFIFLVVELLFCYSSGCSQREVFYM